MSGLVNIVLSHCSLQCHYVQCHCGDNLGYGVSMLDISVVWPTSWVVFRLFYTSV